MRKVIKKAPLRTVKTTAPAPPVEAKPETYAVTLSPELYKKLTSFAASRGIDIESFIRVATTTVMHASRYYDLDTAISFGKYIGEKMETIIRLDPDYVTWAVEHVTGMCLSESAYSLLNAMVDQAAENTDEAESSF